MAPERFNSEITIYSDIYSLGVVILEIISGRGRDHDVNAVRTLSLELAAFVKCVYFL